MDRLIIDSQDLIARSQSSCIGWTIVSNFFDEDRVHRLTSGILTMSECCCSIVMKILWEIEQIFICLRTSNIFHQSRVLAQKRNRPKERTNERTRKEDIDQIDFPPLLLRRSFFPLLYFVSLPFGRIFMGDDDADDDDRCCCSPWWWMRPTDDDDDDDKIPEGLVDEMVPPPPPTAPPSNCFCWCSSITTLYEA